MDGRPQSPPSPARLSLVLPAYNEQAGIRQAVAEADDALARLAADYEILVVDDGSRDATPAFVEALRASRPRVRLLRHAANRGYGAALRTGFEAARFERVAFTDADCQFYLDDLARLLPLAETHAVVAGYRERRQDSWRRRFLSRGYNLLVRTLLGTRVRDCDCALKVFRREELRALLPEAHGFFVNTEMLTRARQLGYAVAEAGVLHRPRRHGRSTVSLGQVPKVLGELLPFWWSRVLFPGRAGSRKRPESARPEQASSGRADSGRSRDPARLVLEFLLLFFLACALFFGRLGAPLLEPQEPRYAEIPRQMLDEGRWLVPVLHGQPYLDKPPLLYWLVMGSYRLFGVHDWAARLVPGTAGVLTVLAVWLWGRRVLGARAGLWGALILCLSAWFVYLERMLTMDSVLCCCVTGALAAAHVSLTSPKRQRGDAPSRLWWALSAVACGLGVLAKGPVALVLVATPVLAYRRLDPRCPRISRRAAAAYLGVLMLVAAPWYVALGVAEPQFAVTFFWTHNVVRFVAPFDHQKPFWFHLPGLLLGMLPWTLLLPGLVRFLARRSARAAARRPPALGFCLLASLAGLAFFSLSGCKRPAYILPVLPPLALALGYALDVQLDRVARQPSWARRGSLAFPATLLTLAGALGVSVIATLLLPQLPLTIGVTLSGATLLALVVVGIAGRAGGWAGCAAAVFAALLAGLHFLLPAYNRQFANPLRDLPSGAPPRRLTVVCYPQRYDSASFYLPDADVRVYAADQRARMLADLRGGDTLLLVKSGRPLQEVLAELPAALEFRAHGSPGAVTAGWVRVRDDADQGVARSSVP